MCVESLATALTDMFPRHLRKKGFREILVLGIAVVCFLLGLPLVTGVSSTSGPNDLWKKVQRDALIENFIIMTVLLNILSYLPGGKKLRHYLRFCVSARFFRYGPD